MIGGRTYDIPLDLRRYKNYKVKIRLFVYCLPARLKMRYMGYLLNYTVSLPQTLDVNKTLFLSSEKLRQQDSCFELKNET